MFREAKSHIITPCYIADSDNSINLASFPIWEWPGNEASITSEVSILWAVDSVNFELFVTTFHVLTFAPLSAEGPLDTKAEDVAEKTYIPSLSHFQDEVAEALSKTEHIPFPTSKSRLILRR